METSSTRATGSPPTPEEHWQSLFANSPDYILTVDRHGRITELNRAAPGSRKEDFIGCLVTDLAPKRDRDRVRALLDRVLTTGAAEIYEGVFTDAEGRPAHYESRFVPVCRDGAATSFLVVTRDVTAHLRAQEALVASEERFRALIEKSADAICLFDAQGIIRYANPATKRVLDYDSSGLSGFNGWNLIHPDDYPAVGAFQAQLMSRPGEALECPSYRLRHRDGSWRWIETIATNLLDLASVGAIVATYRDVTERVRLEERLRQAQKMEAIGLLAGGVAHDFNNLLTVILGFAEQAALDLGPRHPVARDLDCVRQAAETGADLTRKLLSFARRQIRVTTPFDLSATLRNFGGLVRRMVGEDVVVEIDAPALPLPVQGDQGQLQQLLLNLATNARQAMPAGGRLSFSARPLGAACCELTVSDSGIGMDDQTRSRIFEPFFTTRPGGTGLGMSVVFGVVQDHHGSIEIDSAVGRGTTVRVELPLCEPLPPSALDPTTVKLGGSETLLLAEDEPLVRDLVAQSLRRLGYEILTAADGQEAVELFTRQKESVALVVLDVIMPRVGGLEAFRRILQLRPGCKAVFISGYTADASEIAELVANGQAALLPKPFVANDLAARVRELLATSAAEVAAPPP